MQEVYEYILNGLNLKYGDSVVVAVSGGPDSMALLHMVSKVKKALDLEVVCAHVNHNVRRESADEKVFVEKFCKKNNIVFEYMKIEEYGDDNFHNEARSRRYNYFSKIVKKYKSSYLFTAHHGDDLMETILMRIVRGSTLRGYSGFSKIVDMGTYKIVRPFIDVTKQDILNYDKKNKISFVTDASNEKDVYTRNRFRKYIVPEIKKEDIKVHHKFYKFSKTLLEYNDYIDRQVKKIIKEVYPQGVLNIDKFLELDKVIQMKIIYYMLEHIYQDDLMLITDHHAQIIYDMLNSKKPNVTIYLPNNIRAIKTYHTFILTKKQEVNGEYEIDIMDFVNLPNGKNIEVVKRSSLTDNNVCRLNSKDLVLPLRVRSRRDGDRMNIKGMLGSKKIKDIFINEKIPTSERDIYPVVEDSSGKIVWLPGLKKSKFDKQKDEKYDIILRYY
ncbi:MAG: tRNA lysidine(34) synthetase TilS [Bacilli bacterium]|nr:tRNA lysidine(34) synthetase TilS [Bacilli bacterium]